KKNIQLGYPLLKPGVGLQSDSRVLGEATQTSVDGAVLLCQADAPSQSDSMTRTTVHLVCYE
ncbi:hypothetical protein KUCAC02_009854, partial [Chaenocephalus aceratus]